VGVRLDASKLGEELLVAEEMLSGEAEASQPTPLPEPQTIAWVVGSAEVLLAAAAGVLLAAAGC